MGGSTRAWRKTRTQVLERDHYQCQLQLAGCTTHATQVHHTLGRQTTGDDPTYLTAACQPCNLKIGDPTAATAQDPRPEPRTQW